MNTVQLTTRFHLLWLLAFLGFPIGGLVSYGLVGPVENVLGGALSGALTGAVIGLAQWLVLRQVTEMPGWWIAVSSVGMGLGLALGVALVGIETQGIPLQVRGAITGLAVGAMQWLLLRQFGSVSAWWVLVVAIGWAVGWTVTRAVGIDLSRNWAVFGASGAVAFQVITSLALRWLTSP